MDNTLVSAIFALAASSDNSDTQIELLSISIIPIVLFWILDGYFLWQERLFREHYKNIAQIKDYQNIDYQMDIRKYNTGRNTWSKSIFSKTLNTFFLTLFIVMVVIIAVMLYRNLFSLFSS